MSLFKFVCFLDNIEISAIVLPTYIDEQTTTELKIEICKKFITWFSRTLIFMYVLCSLIHKLVLGTYAQTTELNEGK